MKDVWIPSWVSFLDKYISIIIIMIIKSMIIINFIL